MKICTKARDKWILGEEGKRCCHGTATGQYLQNRLELALLAGYNIAEERIKELEGELEQWKNKAIGYKYDLDNLKALKGGK